MQPATKIILYIPGSSGLEDSERIDSLKREVESYGYSFATLCSWKNSADLQHTSISKLLDFIHASINEISEEGYKHICVIGKSFGGALALMKFNPAISRMVLWAPIPQVGEIDIAQSPSALVPLSDLKSFDEITISTDTYSTIKYPVLLVRGTNDQVVSAKQIHALHEVLPQAEIVEVTDMAHSPSTPAEMNHLNKLSVDFLIR